MDEVGPGERSARRVLAVDSAFLIVLVVAVYISILARGGETNFPVWSTVLGVFAATTTLLLGILARWLTDRALRAMALVAVVAYFATIVTFPAAVPAGGIDRIPWTLSASGAAAAAALVAGGRSFAWITVTVGVTAGLSFRALFGGLDLDGVVNDLQALLTGAVICVIGGHILTVGRGLDVAARSTTAAAARESAERGRLSARTRAAALVHDEVLATLTLAASDLPFPRERLAAQARDAASMVHRLSDDQAHDAESLRVILGDEAGRYGASFAGRGEAALETSVETIDALVGAARQALRNSARHAPEASRSVELVQTGTEIRVLISDDGPGFDPAAIGSDRLGIRHSIVGRMSRIAGGSARIESAPGSGTVVHLVCSAAPARQWQPPDSGGSLRVGVSVLAVMYVVIQVVSAILVAVVIPSSWPVQVTVLAMTLAAAEVLRRSPQRVLSPGRTAVVIALAYGSLGIGAMAVHVPQQIPYEFGTMWFAVAAAFLFVTLALRGRIAVALVGMAVIVVVLVITGILVGAPPGLFMQVSFRPVVLVGLAVALLVVVGRTERRINALHQDALASAERESWTLAARSELTGRVAELTRTALPLLVRIGDGGETTDGHRREYASCEGELRDGLRAGALSREPLLSVVAAARERGVDVLLLDDSDDGAPDDRSDHILAWMAEAIASASTRAVGRLLPPGRDALATMTVDGRHSEFPAAPVYPSVMSFHGE